MAFKLNGFTYFFPTANIRFIFKTATLFSKQQLFLSQTPTFQSPCLDSISLYHRELLQITSQFY